MSKPIENKLLVFFTIRLMYTRIGTVNYKKEMKIIRFFADILLQTYLGCQNGEGGGGGTGRLLQVG
jgi:hypothetical protein